MWPLQKAEDHVHAALSSHCAALMQEEGLPLQALLQRNYSYLVSGQEHFGGLSG